MKDNSGLSLIEMIIVLCIAAILLTGAAIGVRSLHYADANYCAKEINSTLYALRTQTLSQGDLHHYLVIEWDDLSQEYYLSIATSSGIALDSSNWTTDALSISNRKKLASESITISYSMDGTVYNNIRGTDSVILISYKPDSGSFESSYKQIQVISESKTSTIFMVANTGNHYMK